MQLDSYIQMKRNGMQIGGNGIENLLVTIALILFYFKKKHKFKKTHFHSSLFKNWLNIIPIWNYHPKGWLMKSNNALPKGTLMNCHP
jgi:hypothetical protein